MFFRGLKCTDILLINVFFLVTLFFHVEHNQLGFLFQFCFLAVQCEFLAGESEEEGFSRRPCSDIIMWPGDSALCHDTVSLMNIAKCQNFTSSLEK